MVRKKNQQSETPKITPITSHHVLLRSPSKVTFSNFYNFREIDEQYDLEEMCNNLVRDMNEYGVCVLDNFIGQEKGLRVLQEVESAASAGYFKVIVAVADEIVDLILNLHQIFSVGWSISSK